MEKIGLIAGNRKFPFLLAGEAKKKNYYLAAVAIKGDASPRLKNFVDKIYWVGLGELNRMIEIFRAEGITKIIMAGQVSPKRLFSKEVKNSPELQCLLGEITDRRADSIFRAIARRLEEAGLQLLDSTTFIEEYLPAKGVLTSAGPDAAAGADIKFGLDLARAIAGLDIGQTVAVKDKAIVAVEALEGTDNLIRRAGLLSRGSGVTVVKVSKPKQDARFDIPVVGLNTVRNLVKAGAKCLAIEAGKTLFIDRAQAVRLADKKGICIIAV
ncbi:MAG: UDP-2,3-diacylglucosamine diphosphatase LpxI [Candidatus Omnitrophota bacterium]|nr:UDP-2,3-diacylglucosamine diphosphatase LpxI [Candidatus Omnitrophota bacterium]